LTNIKENLRDNSPLKKIEKIGKMKTKNRTKNIWLISKRVGDEGRIQTVGQIIQQIQQTQQTQHIQYSNIPATQQTQ
jgi:hypothetical protein